MQLNKQKQPDGTNLVLV